MLRFVVFLLAVGLAGCGSAEANGSASGEGASEGGAGPERAPYEDGGSGQAARGGSEGGGISADDTLGLAGTGGSGSSGEELPRQVHYIRGGYFTRLAIEVDSVEGFEPRPAVEQRVTALFEDVLDKPDGVRVVHDERIESMGSDHVWTFEALRELADATFDRTLEGDEVAMHVMFLDGSYQPEDSSGTVLGLAWSNMHIAMFKQSIERSCQAAGLGLVGSLQEQACEEAELGVWTHEIGHVIGLVDNGIQMVEPHRDADHGRHDESDQCVMYWAYEGDGIVDAIAERLVGGADPTLSFDAACLADIDAVK